jgi:hypothetical protein
VGRWVGWWEGVCVHVPVVRMCAGARSSHAGVAQGTLTVWDAMFALDARFPLFLGVVIMMQVRSASRRARDHGSV